MSGRLSLRARLIALFAGLFILAAGAFCWFSGRGPGPEAKMKTVPVAAAEPPPLQFGRDGYVSSQACAKCHAEQHKSWHNSYHRTMTQIASPQSIVAPFDDVHLTSRGRTYHFERRGDEYWVTMTEPQKENERQTQPPEKGRPLPRLPLKAQRVVLTTGSHVAQTYWVAVADELWQVPWVYHIEGKRWIPDDDSFLLPPEMDYLFHQWNTNCVKCHTSAPIPGQTDQIVKRTQVVCRGVN